MNKLILLAFTFTALTAFAAEKSAPDAEAINTACKADSATAGCGDDKVGTGLLKCMRNYKKSHKDFKFSDGCKAAMKKARQNRKG